MAFNRQQYNTHYHSMSTSQHKAISRKLVEEIIGEKLAKNVRVYGNNSNFASMTFRWYGEFKELIDDIAYYRYIETNGEFPNRSKENEKEQGTIDLAALLKPPELK